MKLNPVFASFLACLIMAGCATTTGTKSSTFASTRPELKETAVAWQGHHYWFSEQALPWSEAAAFARNAGGHLVIIDTSEENEFVTARLQADFSYTGMYRVGTPRFHAWITVKGEPVSYTNWSPGQGPGVEEPFGGIHRSGQWHDMSGVEQMKFVVEWDD